MKIAKNYRIKINKRGDLVLYKGKVLMGYIKTVSTTPGLKD